jgi:hypothetical protein
MGVEASSMNKKEASSADMRLGIDTSVRSTRIHRIGPDAGPLRLS